MTRQEQAAFDTELNALRDKYRIRMFFGCYFSRPGSDEVEGMTCAVNNDDIADPIKLIKASEFLFNSMDLFKAALKKTT